MPKRKVGDSTGTSIDEDSSGTSDNRRLTRSATRNIFASITGKSFRKSLLQTPNRRSLHQPALEEFQLINIRETYFKKPMYFNSVTPMYMFDTSTNSLSYYEDKLARLVLQSEDYDALQVTFNSTVAVRVDVIDELQTENSENEAVCFKITDVNRNTRKETVLYCCVLCSIDPNEQQGLGDNFTVLPVMLWYGKKFLKNIVDDFLKETFKCNIVEVKFTPVDLEWLATMYAINQLSPDHLQLLYASSLKELNNIQYNMDWASVERLVTTIVDVDAEELRIEEVTQTMALFRKEFLFLTSIDLGNFCLCGIVTPTLSISKSGRIRIKHHHRLFPLLGFFTTMAEWNIY